MTINLSGVIICIYGFYRSKHSNREISLKILPQSRCGSSRFISSPEIKPHALENPTLIALSKALIMFVDLHRNTRLKSPHACTT